uniref:Chymotrypsin-like protein n=1 Tax=Glyptapanteles indiensis TaxID=92994 RepID=B7S8X0_GLYIN|nr:chymotrypsin-like protein [Glyptapanteles indiensis]
MAVSQVILVAIIGLALTPVILGKHPSKITHGLDAEIKDWPSIVSIQRQYQYNFGYSHWCGGSLITRRHVLTAAHCLSEFGTGPLTMHDKDLMSVVSGTSDNQQPNYISGIKEMAIHPGFTGDLPDFLHDIGIITLMHDITIDETQNIARLPSSNIHVGTYAVVLGWGYLVHDSGVTSRILQKAPVITLDNIECNQRAPSLIFENQVCGLWDGRRGVCQGDSGGPLISTNNEVIGVVSMTWKCGGGNPDVYTRVYPYLTWIYGVINDSF